MAKIHLYDFEHLNTTTESIYELREFNVLIILKNGENLTNWDDVENKEDIIFISEDLFGKTSLEGRYKDLKNLKAILTFGVGNVTSLKETFSGCESLEEISTLSSWDVSNVTDASSMFNDCLNLTDISALEKWNMSNVENISRMFSGCKSLIDISPLSEWNVGNVRNMYYLFSDCSSIRETSALENWDVSNVRDMGCLFDFCSSLEDISGVANWDLSKVFNITALFRGCTSLKDISALSKWDLSKMTRNKSLLALFSLCISLKNISPLKKWDISNITRLSGLFEGCIQLKDTSALKNWDVSNVTTFDFLFRGCSSLTNISHLKSWNPDSVTSVKGMFDGCMDLMDISPLSDWDVSNIQSMNKMFNNCAMIMDVSCLDSWKVSEDASINSIFDECEKLDDFPKWFKIRAIKDQNTDSEIRQKIIDEIDLNFLKKHNINDFDEQTQKSIVEMVKDQNVLAYFVERSSFKQIQIDALDRISDEEILTDIAIHNHNYDIFPASDGKSKFDFYFYNREMAIVKIKNKVLLAKVAKEMQQVLNNIFHLEKHIDSDDLWCDIALNAKSPYVRLFGMEHVQNQESFEKIIGESDDKVIVKIAKANIKKDDEAESE